MFWNFEKSINISLLIRMVYYKLGILADIQCFNKQHDFGLLISEVKIKFSCDYIDLNLIDLINLQGYKVQNV